MNKPQPTLTPGIYTINLHANGQHHTHNLIPAPGQTETDVRDTTLRILFPGRTVEADQFTLTRHGGAQ